tara:strand:+ start:89 stop:466 length:378 start_codon:yes stop_codon:yes gene_type:complete
MKDTTKLGIYFLIGIIILVVPVTYSLTIMANNLKNIDTYQIVLSVDKLMSNLNKIDTLNIYIKNLTDVLQSLKFNDVEDILLSLNKTLTTFKVNINSINLPMNNNPGNNPGAAPNPSQLPTQLRL